MRLSFLWWRRLRLLLVTAERHRIKTFREKKEGRFRKQTVRVRYKGFVMHSNYPLSFSARLSEKATTKARRCVARRGPFNGTEGILNNDDKVRMVNGIHRRRDRSLSTLLREHLLSSCF